MKTVYLAHKFENQEMGLAVQERLERYGLRVLNPFQRKEQREYDRVIEEEAGRFSDADSAKIVRDDLTLVDRADAVVALLSPNAIGTVCEIFYAGYVQHKPVFTWIGYRMPYRHPWIANCSVIDDTDLDFVLMQVEDWVNAKG